MHDLFSLFLRLDTFKKIQADFQNEAKLCTGFWEATYGARMVNKHLPSIPQQVSEFWFPLLYFVFPLSQLFCTIMLY